MLEHRYKVYKEPLGRLKIERKAGSGQDPLGRLKPKVIPGSGQEPDEPSMYRKYAEADAGTWRERMREMLPDGSVLYLKKGPHKKKGPYKEHCREVTGKKINKLGRWWGRAKSSEFSPCPP